jgi:hypothetical protein
LVKKFPLIDLAISGQPRVRYANSVQTINCKITKFDNGCLQNLQCFTF